MCAPPLRSLRMRSVIDGEPSCSSRDGQITATDLDFAEENRKIEYRIDGELSKYHTNYCIYSIIYWCGRHFPKKGGGGDH